MPTWRIDPDHSVASFAIGHMMVAVVHGIFNSLSGAIRFDPADPASISAEITIDAARMTTGIAKRDAHLKSPDFFDVEHFPTISFTSASAEVVRSQKMRVAGELTLHGVTRPVTLDVTWAGPVTSDDGDTSIGFSAKASLNREDFGLTWNVPIGDTGFMVGKHVDLSMEVEADLSGE